MDLGNKNKDKVNSKVYLHSPEASRMVISRAEILNQERALEVGPAPQSIVQEPPTSASPGSLLEVQNLLLHLRPIESESAS